MNKLIIITGDLAAGKSTLAASLSHELNIPFFTKDSLKEIACDVIGFTNREENRHLSISAINSMFYCFSQLAQVGSDAILEANFRSEELAELKKLCYEYNYQAVLLVLTGDYDLLYQRFMDRLSTRHPAHRSLNLDYSLERFVAYVNELRNQDFVFSPFYIDMSDLDEDEVVEEALKIIESELGI